MTLKRHHGKETREFFFFFFFFWLGGGGVKDWSLIRTCVKVVLRQESWVLVEFAKTIEVRQAALK